MSNGLSISPLKSREKPDSRSLREIVTAIDNSRDLNQYLMGYHAKVPPRTGEPKYERHPVSTTWLSQLVVSLPGRFGMKLTAAARS